MFVCLFVCVCLQPGFGWRGPLIIPDGLPLKIFCLSSLTFLMQSWTVTWLHTPILYVVSD